MIPRSIQHAIDRDVTREELRDSLERPISESERSEAVALYRWFTTRYRSAEERLAYVRQAYARWRRDIDYSR
jgi:hypothetical protein